MRTLQIIALLGVAAYANSQDQQEQKELDEKFSMHIAKNGRQISNHDEYKKRKSQFKKASEQVQKMNQQGTMAKFSTDFAGDMLPEEMNSMFGEIQINRSSRQFVRELQKTNTNEIKEEECDDENQGEVKKKLKEEKKKNYEELKEEKKKLQEKVDDKGKEDGKVDDDDKRDDQKKEESKKKFDDDSDDRQNVDEESSNDSERFYINWVEQGKVSPVKNSHLCSSWVYAASLVVESKFAIQKSTLLQKPILPEPLSMQQILDCFDFYDEYRMYQDRNRNACFGGHEEEFWRFSNKYGNKAEKDYPFTGQINAQDCEANQGEVVARAGQQILRLLSVESMKSALQEGPFTVILDATQDCFMHFQSGILTKESCQELNPVNHLVTVVGYGSYTTFSDEELDYWLIQNAWGHQWGDNGFIRIAAEEDYYGVLGMNTEAFTVDVLNYVF